MSPESTLTWETPFGATVWWLTLALGLLILTVGVLSTAGRPPWVRVAVGVLRGIAVAGVLLLLWRPQWQRADVTRGRDRVAVLVDTSVSMALPAAAGGPSRAAQAEKWLRGAKPVLRRWGAHRGVDRFTYATGLRRGPPGKEKPHQRRRTDLLGALEQVRSGYRGRQLAGVVVLSDGRDTARLREGVSPALKARLRALDVPVNVVPLGDRGVRDVSVAEVTPDDLAFVRNVTRVRAVVRVAGTTRAVDVSLWLDGRRIETRRAVGGAERQVVFELNPSQVGAFTGRVEAEALPGEATRANNARRFVLRVVRDRVRVLQIAGRPSWDVRFLRQHFKRDPNVDLVSFFILRTHRNATYAAPHELSLIQFPAEKLFSTHLDSFDLVVMQDFERYPAYVAHYLDNIAAWVRRGGALAVLGGEHTLTLGGFYGSRLAAALPVELLPQGPPSELLDEQPFKPRWTPLADQHPLTRALGDGPGSLSPALLANLPPLEGVNKVLRAHGDSAVLAVHPRLKTKAGRPMPVVAVRDVARGRTLTFLTDTSWRWRFGDSRDRGATYDAFWRRAVRYLIGDPEFARLRVLTARGPYGAGRPVAVAVHASDLKRRPQPDARIAWRLVTLEGPGAPREIQSGTGRTDAAGRLPLKLGQLPPGSYRVEAKGVLDGRSQHARGVFVTEGEAPELARVDPAPGLLTEVARATGGRVLRAPSELARARLHPARVIKLDNVRTEPLLGSAWWLLVVVTFALAGEWILRRRFALA